MNLNLHIIKEELADLGFEGEPSERCIEFPYAFALPFDPTRKLMPEALYVARAADLAATKRHLGAVGVVCIGRPSAVVLRSAKSLIFTTEDADPGEVLERIVLVFAKFAEWEGKLADILLSHQEAARFGVVSRGMVANPFFVANDGMRVLFHETEVLKQESPEAHRRYCRNMSGTDHPVSAGSFPPADVINDVIGSQTYADFQEIGEPALFEQESWPYRTLAFNLGTKDNRQGTIVMDEVLHPFTARDYALLYLLGDFVERAIRAQFAEKFLQPAEASYVLDGLLSHRYLDESVIETAVRRYGWAIRDEYACVFARSTANARSEELFELYADALSGMLESPCYCTFDGGLVIVVNLTRMQGEYAQLSSRMTDVLERNLLRVGISRPFSDFKNLFYFYRQAQAALELDGLGSRAVMYDHVAFEDALNHVRHGYPAETLQPAGLHALFAYDEQHGTGFTQLLQIYLDANMSPTETSKRAFLARNTCMYRIKRICEICGTDFSSPEERILYQLALLAARGRA